MSYIAICLVIAPTLRFRGEKRCVFKSISLFVGQSYEIKLKRLGDLSEFQGKYLRVSSLFV